MPLHAQSRAHTDTQNRQLGKAQQNQAPTREVAQKLLAAHRQRDSRGYATPVGIQQILETNVPWGTVAQWNSEQILEF